MVGGPLAVLGTAISVSNFAQMQRASAPPQTGAMTDPDMARMPSISIRALHRALWSGNVASGSGLDLNPPRLRKSVDRRLGIACI